jgi:hypothetical protein
MVDYDTMRTDESAASISSYAAVAGYAFGQEIESDELATAEGFDLPDIDLSDEKNVVTVAPKQNDEFTCTSCYLICRKSQMANDDLDNPICKDCE